MDVNMYFIINNKKYNDFTIYIKVCMNIFIFMVRVYNQNTN